MSEVLKKMETRRSIRKYKKDAVPQEILDQILEAGLYAASGRGQQNTIMIQVTDPKMRDEIAAKNCEIVGWGEGFDPFYGAKTVIVVLADAERPTRVEDGSLVLGNMMNAAASIGLGSCWIHRAKEVFEFEEGKKLKQKWGIPESCVGIGHCIIGYTDDAIKQAADRKSDYVVYSE